MAGIFRDPPAPVVMVHGWAGSFARTWQGPGVSELVKDSGRRVIGVDLLGHGDAPKPHDPAAYADLTQRILDALPEGPVDAVGFSLGAMTLLQLICCQPDRFGRVVLAGIGDGLFEPDPNRSGSEQLARALEGSGDPLDRQRQQLADHGRAAGNDPVALVACLRRPMPPDPVTEARCAAVQSRVLVAIGDEDFAHPADRLAAAFPHGTLKVLRRCDHSATPEHFGFIDAMLGFLES
jgi:pimeloyl-ACP methyl ester carboxylesterase